MKKIALRSKKLLFSILVSICVALSLGLGFGLASFSNGETSPNAPDISDTGHAIFNSDWKDSLASANVGVTYDTATEISFLNYAPAGYKDSGKIIQHCRIYVDGTKLAFVSDVSTTEKISARYDCGKLFADCAKVTKFDFSFLEFSLASSFDSMFANCTSLESLDLSSFDFSGVTSMNSMFSGAVVGELNLSNIKVTRLTSMDYMFENATIKKLNLSNINPSSLTSMVSTFTYATIKDLDLSNFNSSKVTTMLGMFQNANIKNINVKNFKTSSVSQFGDMFHGSTFKNFVDLSGFDFSSFKNSNEMFKESYFWGGLDLNIKNANQDVMNDIFSWAGNGDFSSANVFKYLDMRDLLFTVRIVVVTDNLTVFYTPKITDFLDFKETLLVDAITGNGTTSFSGNFDALEYVKEYSGYFPESWKEWLDAKSFGIKSTDVTSIRFESVDPEGYGEIDKMASGIRFFQSKTNPTDIAFVFHSDDGSGDYRGKITAPISCANLFYGLSNLTSVTFNNFHSEDVRSMSGMFDGCTHLESVDLATLDTTNVRDMSNMFAHTSAKLDLSKLNTTNVETMSGMFKYFGENNKDAVLDLSKLNTSSVEDMSYMFEGYYLKKLDVSKLDTSNVTNMAGMFYSLYDDVELNLKGIDTSKVTDMSKMFASSYALMSLDLSGLDASSVTNFYGMFVNCESLQKLDISSFNTSSATNMSSMFSYCGNLTELDLSSFDTSNVTDFLYMFKGSSRLQIINLSSFVVSASAKVTGMLDFGENKNLKILYTPKTVGVQIDIKTGNTLYNSGSGAIYSASSGLSNAIITTISTSNGGTILVSDNSGYFIKQWNEWMINNQCGATCDTATSIIFANTAPSGYALSKTMPTGIEVYLNSSKNTDIAFVFNDTIYAPIDSSNLLSQASGDSLSNIEFNNFNTSLTTNMRNMFACDYHVSTLDLSCFNTSKVTDMYGMFTMSGVSVLNISSFDTSNVINMNYMFDSCANLTDLDLSHFDTSKVTNMSYMFNGCESLRNLNIKNFNTANVTTMRNMFSGCKQVIDLDVSSFNTAKVTTMNHMFAFYEPDANFGSTNTSKLILTNFDTSNVTDMSYMFCGNTALSVLDVSSFNTSKVTTMNYMFYSCVGLTNLDVSNFDTVILQYMNSMFADMTSLLYLDTSGMAITAAVGNSSCFSFGSSNYIQVFKTPKTVKAPTTFSTGSTLVDSETGSTVMMLPAGKTLIAQNSSYFDLTYWKTQLTSAGVDISTVTSITFSTTASSSDTLVKTDSVSGISAYKNGTAITFVSSNSICVYDCESMFVDFTALQNVNLANFNTSGVSSMKNMFSGLTNLVNVTFSDNIDVSSVIDLSGMFQGCSSLTSVTFNEGFYPKMSLSFSHMFDGCSSLRTINLSTINTYNAEDLSYMFNNCSSLTSITIFGNGWVVDNAKNLAYMFYGCSSLVSLDLTGFVTPNATDMSYMFAKCSALTSLDLSKFNTSNVTNMAGMFQGASNLIKLDLSSFDTSKVTAMNLMFSSVNATDYMKLESINLSSFNTSNVTTFKAMFQYCKSLIRLDLSNFYTSSATDMAGMFINCSSLRELNLTNFNTSNVVSFQAMFQRCESLEVLDVSKFDTSNATIMRNMFSYCSSLEKLDVSNFDTSKVQSFYAMFQRMGKVAELNVSGFDTSNATDMSYMFNTCSSLTELNVSNFDTSKVQNFPAMFQNCSNLTKLDVSNLDTSNATDMRYMFFGCSGLTELDLSNFNTQNATNISCMFKNCSVLKTLNISSFNTSKVTDMGYMFHNCIGLTNLDVSGFDTSNVTTFNTMFGGCTNLTSLDVSNFNTSKVTNMQYLFANCYKLRRLDLSNFDTSNVLGMKNMFWGCTELETVDLSHFSGAKVTDLMDMFKDCSALREVDLSGFGGTPSATTMQSMFAGCTSLVKADLSGLSVNSGTVVTNMLNFGSTNKIMKIVTPATIEKEIPITTSTKLYGSNGFEIKTTLKNAREVVTGKIKLKLDLGDGEVEVDNTNYFNAQDFVNHFNTYGNPNYKDLDANKATLVDGVLSLNGLKLGNIIASDTTYNDYVSIYWTPTQKLANGYYKISYDASAPDLATGFSMSIMPLVRATNGSLKVVNRYGDTNTISANYTYIGNISTGAGTCGRITYSPKSSYYNVFEVTDDFLGFALYANQNVRSYLENIKIEKLSSIDVNYDSEITTNVLKTFPTVKKNGFTADGWRVNYFDAEEFVDSLYKNGNPNFKDKDNFKPTLTDVKTVMANPAEAYFASGTYVYDGNTVDGSVQVLWKPSETLVAGRYKISMDAWCPNLAEGDWSTCLLPMKINSNGVYLGIYNYGEAPIRVGQCIASNAALMSLRVSSSTKKNYSIEFDIDSNFAGFKLSYNHGDPTYFENIKLELVSASTDGNTYPAEAKVSGTTKYNVEQTVSPVLVPKKLTISIVPTLQNGTSLTASSVVLKSGTVTYQKVNGMISEKTSEALDISASGKTIYHNSTYDFSVTDIVANSGYVFVGMIKSGESAPNPSAQPPDTITYENVTNGETYYLVFKAVSDNLLKYDSEKKYFYFENGEIIQSYVGDMMNSTLNAYFVTDKLTETIVSTYAVRNGATNLTVTTHTYSDGGKYGKMTATQSQTLKLSTGDVTFTEGETYWFKVEPIRWRVSDYGVSSTDVPEMWKGYGAYNSGFIAVSDKVLWAGSLTTGKYDAYNGWSVTHDAITDMRVISNTKFNGGFYTSEVFTDESNDKVVTNVKDLGTRLASREELEENFTDARAQATDFVAFVLGIDTDEYSSYWTRSLGSKYYNVKAVGKSGILKDNFTTNFLGFRFSITFGEGSRV